MGLFCDLSGHESDTNPQKTEHSDVARHGPISEIPNKTSFHETLQKIVGLMPGSGRDIPTGLCNGISAAEGGTEVHLFLLNSNLVA